MCCCLASEQPRARRYERLQEDFGHAKTTIATLREDVEKFGREAIDNRKKLHEAERRAAMAEDTANRLEAERDRAFEGLDAARRRIGELEREAAEEKQKHFNQLREMKNAEYRRQWQAQVCMYTYTHARSVCIHVCIAQTRTHTIHTHTYTHSLSL
jgi:hypothetical protein